MALTSDRFLTRTWNNRLTVLLGLPTLVWVITALGTSSLSDRTAFIGLSVLAVVY